VAGQLTQHWTESIWGQVARILAKPRVGGVAEGPNATERRQRQVRLNKAQTVALVAEYQAGASITALAAKYHVDHATVVLRLKRAGVPTRPPGHAIPDGELPRVLELRSQGWTYTQIAERYGCCRRTVQNTLRREMQA
jgi:uncharacterized protein (DUF433 family)